MISKKTIQICWYFTEAAYAIDLTQSAVSHALAALESELGVTLLERNRKGVVALTDVGQKIIPHVRTLLAQVEAMASPAAQLFVQTASTWVSDRNPPHAM